MGQASSHALGLALGCTDEKVLVLDGDGSLLMNLGSLITIGSCAPENLWHFVLNNGIYEVNGDFPIPGGLETDFSSIATAAGFPRSYNFDDIEEFRKGLPEVLAGSGPVFVCLKVICGEHYPRNYETIHDARQRASFKSALMARLSTFPS
jgi:phosphonopyruvate decarboxylase